jgi:hypothetical protein
MQYVHKFIPSTIQRYLSLKKVMDRHLKILEKIIISYH